MDHLLTTAPNLPALLDQLQAAQEKRLTTPTSQCVGPVLEPVLMTEADCEEADELIRRYKLPRPGNPLVDGYEADRQARAEAFERGSRRFT